MFGDCDSFDKALITAEKNKELLKNSAQDHLIKLGCKEKVNVDIGEKFYESRVLDGVVYPFGKYCSVRISIGEGKGNNWWCVLFSPLSDAGIKYSDKGGKNKVKIKFFLAELFA